MTEIFELTEYMAKHAKQPKERLKKNDRVKKRIKKRMKMIEDGGTRWLDAIVAGVAAKGGTATSPPAPVPHTTAAPCYKPHGRCHQAAVRRPRLDKMLTVSGRLSADAGGRD